MAILVDLPSRLIINCPRCFQVNSINNKKKVQGRYRCGNCKHHLSGEFIRLHYLLVNGEYDLELDRDAITLRFESEGTKYIERGTVVEMFLFWNEGVVSLELPLLSIDDMAHSGLDEVFLLGLLYGNAQLGFAKFAIGESGLTLITDLYADSLSLEELEEGMHTTLAGVEIYAEILGNWLGSLAQDKDVDFYEIQYELEEGRELENEQASTKGTLTSALVGAVKLGLSAAALTGIAAAAGVPAAAIGGILTALVARKVS